MTKISQLTDIGSGLAPNDEFIIRDVSDASTPNKKVTASGFFVVASALGITGFDNITAGLPATGTQTRVYASGISGRSDTTISGITVARTTISGYYENASGVSGGTLFPIVTQTDIGSAANQLSLNGMLGDMAFQSAAAINVSRIDIQGDSTTLLNIQGATTSGTAETTLRLAQPATALGALNEIRSGVASGTNPYLAFAVRDINSPYNTVERTRIDGSGRFLVGTSAATANGGVLQVSNGITFPATQSACTDVNTLDDYEEGTWTPVVEGTSTAGTASYSIQTGSYTKVGRLVHISFYLIWSSGTGTGSLKVTGLPFVPGALGALAISNAENIVLSANTYASANVHTNNNIFILQTPTGGGAMTNVTYDPAGTLLMAGSYSV